MAMIRDNVARIRDRIAAICPKAGRHPEEITLVGVTKFASIEDIDQAVAAGINDIAENRVQEAQKKFPLVNPAGRKLTRHLIGHLQTNKVKAALNICDLIQSVDSLKLAGEIERQAAQAGRVADILMQVNTARETQKYGIAPEEALPLIGEVLKLPKVRILGLMAMAPFTEDAKVISACFGDLRRLKENIERSFPDKPGVQMKYLSMGMSHDFEIAIAEGANMVRIGTAIFKE